MRKLLERMRDIPEKLESFAEMKRVRNRRRIASIDRRLEGKHAISTDVQDPSRMAEPAAEVTGTNLEIQLLPDGTGDYRMETAFGQNPLRHAADSRHTSDSFGLDP